MCIEIENSALTAFVDIANRLAHVLIGVFGEIERGQREPRVARFAEGAARLQHFDLHGVVGSLEARQERLFQFGS